MERNTASEGDLLNRISVVPGILGGKPIIRGRRLAVEHVLGMLAAGDDPQTILDGYPWMEPEESRLACSTPAAWWGMNGSSRCWWRTMDETSP